MPLPVKKERVTLSLSIEDWRLLQELENRIDLEDARAALKEAKKKGTVPWEKIKADLGL